MSSDNENDSEASYGPYVDGQYWGAAMMEYSPWEHDHSDTEAIQELREVEQDHDRNESCRHVKGLEYDFVAKVQAINPDGFEIQGYHILADMAQFPHVTQGETVKIRAGFRTGTTVRFKEFSNILLFPPEEKDECDSS
jgi:hypothetical protein